MHRTFATIATAALLAGCNNLPPADSKATMAQNKSALYSPSIPASAAAAEAKVPPGMNERGEVVDSAKIEAGHGQRVKGVDGWDGEIIGKPVPGTKFEKLQIGMPMAQVLKIAGEPSDGGTRVSGTMFNPLYIGNDKYKRELLYPGVGRLVFGDSVGFAASSGGRLIWIIYNPNEPATR